MQKRKVISRGVRYHVGIDEVGRGSLAGPVVVAAVALSNVSRFTFHDSRLGRLRDSKKLSAQQRERWFRRIKEYPNISYAIARVYPRGIERMNISRAANLAVLRAYRRLVANCKGQMAKARILLDGGLYLGNIRRTTRIPHLSEKVRDGLTRKNISVNLRTHQYISASTITRGDEKFTAVKLASIAAKVVRDRYMTRLAKRHPQYGFEVHKGYGTKMHFAAIRAHGPSKEHRLTFIGFLKNFKSRT